MVGKLEDEVRADVIRERKKIFNFGVGDFVRYKRDCGPERGSQANIKKPRVKLVDSRGAGAQIKLSDVEKLLTMLEWKVIGPDPKEDGKRWILEPRSTDTQHLDHLEEKTREALRLLKEQGNNIQINVDVTCDLLADEKGKTKPLRRFCPCLEKISGGSL